MVCVYVDGEVVWYGMVWCGLVRYGVAWSLGVTMGNVGLEIKVDVERSFELYCLMGYFGLRIRFRRRSKEVLWLNLE
jgi:hypothetical protein